MAGLFLFLGLHTDGFNIKYSLAWLKFLILDGLSQDKKVTKICFGLQENNS
jgi:hypothetical protein